MGSIIQDARHKPPIPTFGAMRPLSAPGDATPPVRILNPDGSLRETLSAKEFRRRHPARRADTLQLPIGKVIVRLPYGPQAAPGGKLGR